MNPKTKDQQQKKRRRALSPSPWPIHAPRAIRAARRHLRAETWRHLVSVLGAGVLATALGFLLPTDGAPGTDVSALSTEVGALSVLSIFAFYGPIYLALSMWAWRTLTGQDLRTSLQRTALPDDGVVRRYVVGSPTQIASTAALLALVAVWIVAIRPGAPLAALLISLACVAGSWVLVMATFAVEYARAWATEDGFRFTGDEPLTFGDFIYLAAVVSTTYSSSDVSTMNRRARNLVTIHSITAFVFGTVILAFLVALVLNTVSA